MAWADVEALIDTWSPTVQWTTSIPVSTVTNRQEILDLLENLYNLSTEAAAVLEAAVTAETRIRIGYADGSAGFSVTGGGVDPYIGIDLATAAQLMYFNDSGVLVMEKPDLTVIHELIHNILALSDPQGTGPMNSVTQADMNGATFDFAGDTLALQNVIAGQMGYADNHQVSYGAAFLSGTHLAENFTTGVSYSDNQHVDIARLGGGAADDMDMSARTDASRDLVFGLGGADTIDGGGGGDYLYGGLGDDDIEGGEGDDLIYGGDNNDTLRGGNGNDVLYAGDRGANPGSLGAGFNDTLFGDVGDDVLWGGAGDDKLDGGDGADQLNGGEGNDLLVGGAGTDILTGGDGDDVLTAGDGDDVLDGAMGNDLLIAGAGTDILTGGEGDDILIGKLGTSMSGGAGNDWFWFERGTEKTTLPSVPDYKITDGEAGDSLYWNGYQLTGGEFIILDNETLTEGGATERIRLGSYLGDYGIVYDWNPFFPEQGLTIILPTNEALLIADFTNGDFGMIFAEPPAFDDWDSLPESNIANSGVWLDLENLTGRSAALTNPGPMATPTAPQTSSPFAAAAFWDQADLVSSHVPDPWYDLLGLT